MDKERVVHAYNGILLSHKKNNILPCAATWHIILIQEKPEKKKSCQDLSRPTRSLAHRSLGEGVGSGVS